MKSKRIQAHTILDYWKERTCPVCHKKFYKKGKDYAYQKSRQGMHRVYCSWGCMRKDEGVRK